MLHDEKNRRGKPKQSMSYYGTILNQMVVKTNGELFRKFTEKLVNMPSMIMGIDSSRAKEGGMKYVLSRFF
jgi:hypothetical protein